MPESLTTGYLLISSNRSRQILFLPPEHVMTGLKYTLLPASHTNKLRASLGHQLFLFGEKKKPSKTMPFMYLGIVKFRRL